MDQPIPVPPIVSPALSEVERAKAEPPIITEPPQRPSSPTFLILLIAFSFFINLYFANKLYSPQFFPKPSASPVAVSPSPASPAADLYQDPENRFSFQIPSGWKIISQVPEEFLYHDFSLKSDWLNFINSPEGLSWWLEGKMFGGDCRGPMIQNTDDASQLIALEIVPADNDGAWCWSSGYFFEDNKWQAAENYMYPITQDNSGKLITPEWQGDFFKYQTIAKNSKWLVSAGLANLGTYTLKGESALTQILSTFKFTDSAEASAPEEKFTGKKFGYIKAVIPQYDSYIFAIDLAEFVNDDSAPDGFRLNNATFELTNFPVEHLLPEISSFISNFESNPSVKNSPYWLEITQGTITKITEQYIP